MRRCIYQAISVGVLILLLSLPVGLAQSSNSLVGYIPFSFHIGQATLPAGEYVVTPVLNNANKYIRIRSKNSERVLMLLTAPTGDRSRNGDAKLVFNRYGSIYFLSKISSPADGISEMLFKGGAEVEAAANTPKASVMEIALVRR